MTRSAAGGRRGRDTAPAGLWRVPPLSGADGCAGPTLRPCSTEGAAARVNTITSPRRVAPPQGRRAQAQLVRRHYGVPRPCASAWGVAEVLVWTGMEACLACWGPELGMRDASADKAGPGAAEAHVVV
jgi:hypothetical protein